MTVFRYSAIDEAGHSVMGSLEADTEHALYALLKDRGLVLQKVATGRSFFKHREKVRQEDLIEFSHQMAFIVESGMPLIQGLHDVQYSLKQPTFKMTLGSIINDLSAGDLLSQSLARYPEVFSKPYVAIISAGETSGNLVEAFRDIARYLEWLLNLKRQIKQALIYPAIVMSIMSIAMVIFVTYVIPRLVSFILELNRPIPLPTRILIRFNQFFLDWWPYLLGFLICTVVGTIIALRFERVRFFWDQHKLQIPRVGELFRDLALVRFVNYLRILYRSGIQIHHSFEILQGVVVNRFYQQKLDRIRHLIMGGESFADAMERVGGFPLLMERSFRVGERAGAIEGTLEQLGSFMNRQIDTNVKRITTLLEPVLLILIGVVIIFIVISVLWPVYGILGEIG